MDAILKRSLLCILVNYKLTIQYFPYNWLSITQSVLQLSEFLENTKWRIDAKVIISDIFLWYFIISMQGTVLYHPLGYLIASASEENKDWSRETRWKS